MDYGFFSSKAELPYNRLVASNIIKAVAIIFVIMNHTINDAVTSDERVLLTRELYLMFWMFQAVSLFIVVTGIHFTKSLERIVDVGNIYGISLGETIFAWYQKRIFIKKLKRFLMPYTLEQIIYLLYFICIEHGVIGKKIFINYFKGGVGPGGYYTACMIQILILFPVLYYLIKRYQFLGVTVIISINVLYEIMVRYGWISASFHRVCSIRYLTGLMFGILICLYYNRIKGTVIPWILFIVGGGVLLGYSGGGYKLKIITSWVSSSFAVAPYSAAIVLLVISYESKFILFKQKMDFVNKIIEVIEYIGKATYHIFLVQQLYFCTIFYNRGDTGIIWASIFDICICVVTGCLFYYGYVYGELFFKKLKAKKGI